MPETGHPQGPVGPVTRGEPVHPSSVLVPVPGTFAARVGDSMVVYDPGTQSAHLLNATAAMLRDRCDGTRSIASLTSELSERFGSSPHEILDDVLAASHELVGLRVLQPVAPDSWSACGEQDAGMSAPATPGALRDPVGAPAGAATAPVVASDASTRSAGTEPRTSELDLLGTPAVVVCEDPATLDYLERALRPLRARHQGRGPTSDAPDPMVFELCHDNEGSWEARAEGQVLNRATEPALLAEAVLYDTTSRAVRRCASYILFHASAVVAAGGVVAFPAQPNGGKSTLATALVEAGYRYVTDEALAIDPTDGTIVAFPKPIGLDAGSHALFPHLEPDTDERFRSGHEPRWWVDPIDVNPLTEPASPGQHLSLCALVFPAYTPGAAGALEPLAAPEAAYELITNAFNLAIWSGAGVELIASTVESVPSYRLFHDDLGQACRLVASISPPPATSRPDT